MTTKICLKALALVGGAFVMFSAVFGWPTSASAEVSFSDDILPILKLRCVECHQPGGMGYEKSGLDLRSYESLMKGTRFGPVVVPRQPLISTLNAAIEWRTSSQIHMPYHRKKLTACEIRLFRQWVAQGARNN